MGYYFAIPDVGQLKSGIADADLGINVGSFISLNKPASEVNTLMAPLRETFANSKQEWGEAVAFSGFTVPYPDLNSWWLKNISPQEVGFDGRIGSRLLSNDSLLGDFNKLNAALRKATPITASELLGHLVAGPGVRKAKPPGGNAVNPAWRKAYTHVGMYMYLHYFAYKDIFD